MPSALQSRQPAEGARRVRAGDRAPRQALAARPDMVDARSTWPICGRPGPPDDAVETWRRLLGAGARSRRGLVMLGNAFSSRAHCRRARDLPAALALKPRLADPLQLRHHAPGRRQVTLALEHYARPSPCGRTMSRRTGTTRWPCWYSGDLTAAAGIRMALAPGLLREAGARSTSRLAPASRLPASASCSNASRASGHAAVLPLCPWSRRGSPRDHPRGAAGAGRGPCRQPGADGLRIVPWIRVPGRASLPAFDLHCP